MFPALLGLLLAFACMLSPIFYAMYVPVKDVPVDSPPVVFFHGKLITGLGNCPFGGFKLANPTLEGTYNIIGLLQRLPGALGAIALLNIVAIKRISKIKFLIGAILVAAGVEGILLIYSSNQVIDCTFITQIRITSLRLYEPTIILWVSSLTFSIFALRSVHKAKQKVA